MLLSDIQTIEKEQVPALHFHKNIKISQKPDLKNQLELATRLGNGYRSKVSIVFYTDEGIKRIHTTIWATGENYICLKGGVWLPISHILDLEF